MRRPAIGLGRGVPLQPDDRLCQALAAAFGVTFVRCHNNISPDLDGVILQEDKDLLSSLVRYERPVITFAPRLVTARPLRPSLSPPIRPSLHSSVIASSSKARHRQAARVSPRAMVSGWWRPLRRGQSGARAAMGIDATTASATAGLVWLRAPSCVTPSARAVSSTSCP